MIDVSNFVESLDGKAVAVFGLGVSNRSVIQSLVAAKVPVVVWDDDGSRRVEILGVEWQDLLKVDFSSFGCLVLAPGVPLSHPVAQAAREADIEIICDIEILHRSHHGCLTIGITGTNGKSTTAALIAHILNDCGVKVVLGGNIGKPVLSLSLSSDKTVIVLELSSYQLDLCPTFRPDISVLINISPDHIEHHGSMERYVESKARIVEGEGRAVISVDDEWCRDIFASTKRDKTSISVEGQADIFIKDGSLYEGQDIIGGIDITSLRGIHNHQNIAAAFAACRQVSVTAHDIMAAIQPFPGLPHRQSLVRMIGSVAYVNDSKATNIEAAAKALACHDHIYWIAGGCLKDDDLQAIEPYVEKISQAFLIGEAAGYLKQWLEQKNIQSFLCDTMDVAVREAHKAAQTGSNRRGGATVLLSPACSSFDQFKNFEERGNLFVKLVNDLKEEAVA